MSLREIGWDDAFARGLEALRDPGLAPGRIVASNAGFYRLWTETCEVTANLAGRIKHAASRPSELPAVGDWVAFRLGATGEDGHRIEHVLPRRSLLSRKAAGRRSEEQVVAANVDVAFVVMGLDGDFNVRRIERFLTTIWESGARPVVVLNKADLCEDAEDRRVGVEAAAPGVPVLTASALTGAAIDGIAARIAETETAVLLGSSGAGKSTLINRLLGASVQATADVREGDDRGRHTTTHRELFRIPGGGCVIDNPGVRELQPWSSEESLERAFEDVFELSAACRFRDCGHDAEPGCAVRAAVESGALPAERLDSFRKLKAGLRHLEVKADQGPERAEKHKWRSVKKEQRRFSKHRGR